GLSAIPIADEVKDALLKHKGRCGLLYDLALSYERADWPSINELANQLGIPTNVLTSVYFNCVDDVYSVWKQLTTNMMT
ncbi:MAG: diguanylate phosphodiesterase, partial [Pygmaiobacter massiliensis]|nr:diguanylate phosphodiesterase [Pygmaiobacter massiliensis]